MNNTRKTLIMLSLLIFIISTSVQSVLAQENVTNEDIIIDAHRSLDRSLNILNLVVSAIGVMITLLAVVIAVLAAFGFLEIKGWKKTRQIIEKEAESAKKTVDYITGLKSKAEMELDKIRQNKSLPPPSLTEKTQSEEILKKLDESNPSLELYEFFGVTLKPEDHFNLGRNLFHKGKYEDSLKAFEKAIELKYDYADALSGKGAVLSKLGRNDEALEAIEKAIVLKHDFANGWVNKGYVLNKLGRHDEALEAIEKAIELKPDQAEAWHGKSVILSSLGRHDKALKTIEKAIELKVNYGEGWHDKGYVLTDLSRYDEALKAYKKAIEIKQDYASAWYNIACIYSIKGEKEKALFNLKKAIEIDISCKEDAKKDEEFKKLRDDEDFKKLVG